MAKPFESEKVLRNDFLPIIQLATSRDDLIARLLEKIPFLRSNKTLAGEIVDGCGGSVTGFAACVNKQQSFYSSWAPRFSLSPDEFERRFNAEYEEFSKANPVMRQFTPSLPRFRRAEAFVQTRRALLQAANAVQAEGTKALDKVPDPYDAKHFQYVPLSEGYRLESRLKEDGTPISFSISLVPAASPK